MAYSIAYVMIKTECGAAKAVAEAVAQIPRVHWAAVVTGPYDVIAGVRVDDNEALGRLVVDKIHNVPGVTETLTAVMMSYHSIAERGPAEDASGIP